MAWSRYQMVPPSIATSLIATTHDLAGARGRFDSTTLGAAEVTGFSSQRSNIQRLSGPRSTLTRGSVTASLPTFTVRLSRSTCASATSIFLMLASAALPCRAAPPSWARSIPPLRFWPVAPRGARRPASAGAHQTPRWVSFRLGASTMIASATGASRRIDCNSPSI